MLELLAMLPQCAPTVAPETMAAIVSVESTKNPFAIGVVGGHLLRQPRNLAEAVATARQLEADGWNFSVGVAQVNRYNLPKYSLDYEKAFDACASLRAGSKILEDCYVRAKQRTIEPSSALRAAVSCYYSGNFTRGFIPDVTGRPSYVQKVWAAAGAQATPIPVVPAIRGGAGAKPKATPAARPGGVPATPEDQAPVLLKPEAKAKDTARRAPDRGEGMEAAGGARQAAEAAQSEQRSSVVVF
jgi:type IV secretion system protein VirB1